MKWTNPRLYLLAGLLTLGPVALRVAFWSTAKANHYDAGQVAEGRTLFTHEWLPNDAHCPEGDGLGPVFNATSCLACHNQGGIGGGGNVTHNVNTFVVQTGVRSRQGVVHASATKREYQETLRDVDPALPAISRPFLRLVDQQNFCGTPPPKQLIIDDGAGGTSQVPFNVLLSQRNTPALFGAKLIDEIPERVLVAQARQQRLAWGLASAENDRIPVGRALRLRDGRIGRFGWQAQSASLADFVQAACANELGLSNPGQKQPVPLASPNYPERGYDLTDAQCTQITAFISSLRHPIEAAPKDDATRKEIAAGKHHFNNIGCANCHVADLGSVDGIYSDLLLHRMGQDLQGGGSYGQEPPTPESPGDSPLPDEWRTPPLWGVADSAPYMHDGRAGTLVEAIQQHGGQAAAIAQRFARLDPRGQNQLVAFLKTLRAP